MAEARSASELRNLVCVDVETLAIGKTHLHSDRAPFRIAAVNGEGSIIFHSWIKVDKPIVSYLTPLTGIDQSYVGIHMDELMSLHDAIELLHSKLNGQVTLVGQYPYGDLAWCALEKGKHYKNVIDISELFVTTGRYGDILYFSLAHEAKVLLNRKQQTIHNPIEDCQLTLELYKTYSHLPKSQLEPISRKLKDAPMTKSIVSTNLNYECDGVCLSGFSSRHCICGKPQLTKSTDEEQLTNQLSALALTLTPKTLSGKSVQEDHQSTASATAAAITATKISPEENPQPASSSASLLRESSTKSSAASAHVIRGEHVAYKTSYNRGSLNSSASEDSDHAFDDDVDDDYEEACLRF